MSSQPALGPKRGFFAPVRNTTTVNKPFRLPEKAVTQEISDSKPQNQIGSLKMLANPNGDVSQTSKSRSQDLFTQKSKVSEELGEISSGDCIDKVKNDEIEGLNTIDGILGALEKLTEELDKEEHNQKDANSLGFGLLSNARPENGNGTDKPPVSDSEKPGNSLDEVIESVIRGEDFATFSVPTPLPIPENIPEKGKKNKRIQDAVAEPGVKQTKELRGKGPKKPRIRVPAVIPGPNNVNETIERVARGEFPQQKVDDATTKKTEEGTTVVELIITSILMSGAFGKKITSPGNMSQSNGIGVEQSKKKTGLEVPEKEKRPSKRQKKKLREGNNEAGNQKVVKKETKKNGDMPKTDNNDAVTTTKAIDNEDIPKQAPSGALTTTSMVKDTSKPVANDFIESEDYLNESRAGSSNKPRKSKDLNRKVSLSQEKDTGPNRKRSKSLSMSEGGDTAKERIKAMQEWRSNEGTWIQCCSSNCRKWRYVESIQDPCEVPSLWYCSDNPDPNFNKCNAPQQDDSASEDTQVELKYSFGSLVWAQLHGYPWWPAMIDDDPDVEEFFWLEIGEQRPSWYHVVFFDRPARRQVDRAWILTSQLRPFRPGQPAPSTAHAARFASQLKEAVKETEKAAEMTMAKRRKTYSFLARYHGKWGKRLDDEQIKVMRKFVLGKRASKERQSGGKRRKTIEWIGLSDDEDEE